MMIRIYFLFLCIVLVAAGCDDGTTESDGDGDVDADADGDGDGDGDVDGDVMGDADDEVGEDGDLEGDGDVEADIDEPEPFVFDRRRIFDDVTYLASDELGGREPGTEGNEAAMDFIEDLFVSLGLAPAGDDETYRQGFAYDHWRIIGTPEVVIGRVAYEYGSQFLPFVYSGSGDVTGELVFVGYGLTIPPYESRDYPDCPIDPAVGYDDYESIDMTGKIALVLRHGPNDDETVQTSCPGTELCIGPECLWTFAFKAANAQHHGAVGMVLVQDYRHDGGIEEWMGTLDEDYAADDFPAVFVDRDLVEASVDGLDRWAADIDEATLPGSRATGVTATIDITTWYAIIETANILGALHGTDPEIGEEVVVVGAHLDHLGTDPATGEIYYGADDNASGTAVMMELARALTSSHPEPARTVLFAGWNAEEQGLLGSCFYVEHPTLPIDDTIAAFSIDMVGAGVGVGLEIMGGLAPENEWIVELMTASAEAQELDYRVVAMDVTENSDHACFAYAGVPAVMAGSIGPHSSYHTPDDTAERIDADDLESSALLMWAVLEPLALGTEGDFLE